jgi:hypothetical protein
MRGKVEVFAIAADGSHSLVAEGSNLVLNGAGESIVDMLTTPSSVLGIAPRVMDTSNFRMAAISFGPAASSFQENGYFFPKDAIWYKTDDLCHGVSSNVSSLINRIGSSGRMRIMWTSSITGEASAYTPPYRLPSYPDPLNKRLEDVDTAYSIVSADGTQSYGQFENRINFNYADPSSYFQGVYPAGVTDRTQAALVSSYEGDFTTDPYVNVVASTDAADNVTGGFNARNYMDYRGFCHLKYDTNPTQPVVYGRTSVSAAEVYATPSAMVVDPRVTYTVYIYRWDVWAMNNYGGLHQIGLWNMDCKKALEANEAPFIYGDPSDPTDPKFVDMTTGVTKQEFKLFAKKTFTENLCAIKDNGVAAGFTNQRDLYIQWTLDFRSQHD